MNPRGSARASLPGTRPSESHNEAAASRQVREMFSRIAPRYDLLNHLLSMRFDVIWRRRVARRCADILARPEARVLDLCCGTGDLALALAGAPESAHGAGSARLIAGDFAHPMLLRAREKSAGKRGRPIELPDGQTAFVTVHPSFLLRVPDEDAKAREYRAFVADLRKVMELVA